MVSAKHGLSVLDNLSLVFMVVAAAEPVLFLLPASCAVTGAESVSTLAQMPARSVMDGVFMALSFFRLAVKGRVRRFTLCCN